MTQKAFCQLHKKKNPSPKLKNLLLDCPVSDHPKVLICVPLPEIPEKEESLPKPDPFQNSMQK